MLLEQLRDIHATNNPLTEVYEEVLFAFYCCNKASYFTNFTLLTNLADIFKGI